MSGADDSSRKRKAPGVSPTRMSSLMQRLKSPLENGRDCQDHAFAIKGSSFIIDIAQRLTLGKVATHTALTFFHRFFKHQSYQQHDRLLTGAACVYLAAKVEERNNVKLSLIVVQYLKFLKIISEDVDGADYNKDSVAREQVPIWKNRIITCERAILYTINFDMNVTHPFRALTEMMKTVRDVMSQHSERAALKDFEHRTFFSQACKFLNDGFSQPHLLDADPMYIAAMALYLTALLYEINPPSGKGNWLDVLQISNEERFLNDCVEAISLYGEDRYGTLNVQEVPEPSLLSITESLSTSPSPIPLGVASLGVTGLSSSFNVTPRVMSIDRRL